MTTSKMVRLVAGLLFLLALAAAQARGQEAAKLHELLDEAWEYNLKEFPTNATFVGDHRYDDRLPSMSFADLARRNEADQEFLRRLETIDRSQLGVQDRISYDMFARGLRESIEDYRFKGYLIPLTADWGFHIGFARLPQQVPLATVKDYENYIARLRAFPTYVKQHIALLREGLATEMTLPRVILTGYEEPIAEHVVEDPTESVFFAPFQRFPQSVPVEARDALRSAGRATIEASVVPGYKAFLEFMVDEYMPGARPTIGAFELPDRPAYYAYLIRQFTTVEISAEEVHQLGLAEVERIKAEMMAVIEEVEFDGGFAAFLSFLRSDPRFYAETPEDLLKEASYIAKRMDGKLPSLFKTLPRLPYGVEPVPAALAPKFTGGRLASSWRSLEPV
jgi:uncharacterized protein (DUF885 family)